MSDDNGLVPDTRAAIHFLEQWAPTGPWTLVAISVDKKEIETATFRPSSNGHLQGWIDQYNGERNLYFAVNPTTRDCSNHEFPRLDEIAALSWLHVDLDPRAGEDLAAERIRCLAALRSPPGSIPPPTCIIYSGGGFQGFWRLAGPFPIGGDLAIADGEAKRWNVQLERDFSADNCHNVNRIMRLPGTINIPDAKKTAKGRIRELASVILFEPSRSYELSLFKQSAVGAKRPDSARAPITEANVERVADFEILLTKYQLPRRVMAIALHGHNRMAEEGKIGDDSRSAWLFDFLCAFSRGNVPKKIAYSVITDQNYKISDSVLDKGTATNRYANRQIDRAYDHIEDPILSQMNDRHAVIKNYGGRCVVGEEITDELGPFLSVQTFKDMTNRYCNRKVTFGKGEDVKYVPMGKWWLENENRREYDAVVFSPLKDVPNMYNLWQGFAYPAKEGNFDLFMDHIRNNICSYNDTHFDYLIRWMASVVQFPDTQGHTAVVLRGKRGTGKSFFVNQFGKLFGRHYMAVSNSAHLVGEFNQHLQQTVLLFADEAFFAGDKRHESVLKTLITEDHIVIRALYMNAISAPNYVHIMMASNDQWVVPAGPDERRFFVMDVSESSIQDIAYFGKIAEQLRNGGYEGLLHYLQNFDLAGFDIRTAPKTDALREQQMISVTSTEEFWFRCLEEGRLVNKDNKWEDYVAIESLYFEYGRFMHGSRRQQEGRISFGRRLHSLIPGLKKESRLAAVPVETDEGWGHVEYRERRTLCYHLPDLLKCREAWEKRVGKVLWTDIDAKIEGFREVAF